MIPRIETLTEKKLVGKRMIMSFTNNKTPELWKSYMPQRKHIHHSIGTDLFSVEIYEKLYFNNFNPGKEFEKWAVVEVSDYNSVPENMETITLREGLYAIFIHKGPASLSADTYHYIFKKWLPSSDYILDNRPHFALMGDKYKHEDPASEEEIWIPIQQRSIAH